jgi:non-heme chloroperoxidase
MQRRNVLKSFAATAIGLGGSSVDHEAIGAPTLKTRVSTRKVHSVSFIQANDGTSLFYRDWGTGPAVVFVAPWGLNSDWWEYQIAYLTGQGLRCIAYDRRGAWTLERARIWLRF